MYGRGREGLVKPIIRENKYHIYIMIFDLKTKKYLPFMTSVTQCNHMVFIIAIISFLIWGFTNEFMRGTSEDDKNRRLWFYVAAILFIGIACLIKLLIIQITQHAK